jgi:hypothetical protein
VSLILEALKKLERDKQGPDRGFLVVAHVPWATKAQGTKLWLGIAGTLLVLALAAGAAFWWTRPVPSRPAPQAVVPPEATLAVPAAPRPSTPPTAALPAVSLPAPVRSEAPVNAAVEPPPPTTLPSKRELRLNAISQREGQWVAVLNDRLVQEGDEFDGIRVVRIAESEVEVEIAGKRRVVRF